MEYVLWLLALLAVGAFTGLVCRWRGLGRAQTVTCVAIALAGTLAATGALVFTSLVECLGENRDRPFSWPWSPRRKFCSDSGSAAQRGALALLLVPCLLTCLGAVLWSKRLGKLAALAFCLIASTLFLPALYVSVLPYYLLDSVPILHDPYVRPATDGRPARACYAFGIVHGPRATPITADTERVCVDLEPTEEASVLVPGYESTSEYAYASVPYDLEWLGKRLTETDLAPGTGYEGLVAERVYTLSGPEALEGAFFVRTCAGCATP
jgi:hypothetical protein